MRVRAEKQPGGSAKVGHLATLWGDPVYVIYARPRTRSKLVGDFVIRQKVEQLVVLRDSGKKNVRPDIGGTTGVE